VALPAPSARPKALSSGTEATGKRLVRQAAASLFGNQIGDAGAAALSEALKSNATLTSLE
jgi:hypothetical protein